MDANREAFDRSTAEGDARISLYLDGIAPPPASPFTGTPPRQPAAPPPAPTTVEVVEGPSPLAWIGRALKSGADAVVGAASSIEFSAPGAVSARRANQIGAIQTGPAPPATPWGWIAAILGGFVVLGLLLRR
jgi:hypothetical protein